MLRIRKNRNLTKATDAEMVPNWSGSGCRSWRHSTNPGSSGKCCWNMMNLVIHPIILLNCSIKGKVFSRTSGTISTSFSCTSPAPGAGRDSSSFLSTSFPARHISLLSLTGREWHRAGSAPQNKPPEMLGGLPPSTELSQSPSALSLSQGVPRSLLGTARCSTLQLHLRCSNFTCSRALCPHCTL